MVSMKCFVSQTLGIAGSTVGLCCPICRGWKAPQHLSLPAAAPGIPSRISFNPERQPSPFTASGIDIAQHSPSSCISLHGIAQNIGCGRLLAVSTSDSATATEVETLADPAEGGLQAPSPAWIEFAEAISGEWDGYGVDFDVRGQPEQLPESVVPQAFRDWGLEIYAWQTQGPTIARPDGAFYSKTIRLIPTVGCEADAATQYSVEEKEGSRKSAVSSGTDCSSSRAASLAGRAQAGLLGFHKEGSYIVSWPGRARMSAAAVTSTASKVLRREEMEGGWQWELEHCLVGEEPEGGGGRTRVRILQRVEREAAKGAEADAPLRLKGTSVYRERWEGEFRNGESLGGCGSSESGFAEAPRTKKEALNGRWKVHNFAASRSQGQMPQGGGPTGQRGGAAELQDVGVTELERELHEEGLVLLPLGMWSQVRQMSEGGYSLTAGWLLEAGKALVSTCEYSASGDLQTMSFSRQEHMG